MLERDFYRHVLSVLLFSLFHGYFNILYGKVYVYILLFYVQAAVEILQMAIRKGEARRPIYRGQNKKVAGEIISRAFTFSEAPPRMNILP